MTRDTQSKPGSQRILVWHDSSHGILFISSIDGGATFERPITVSAAQNYDSHNLAFTPHITAPTRTTNVYVVWHSGNLVRHGKMEALISDVLYGRSTDGGASFGNAFNLNNLDGQLIHSLVYLMIITCTRNGKIIFKSSKKN